MLGISLAVHDHLHSFECVQLRVVETAPDSQLLNLLSVSRLVAVLDETEDNVYGIAETSLRLRWYRLCVLNKLKFHWTM